jgi:glutamate/tyrosine decarboxylase-like PLP-dependent enzyme
MSWKHLGTAGLGRLIEHNLDLAAHLAERCRQADDFEALPAAPELSVVCFRHLPAGRDPRELDAHQDRLQQALAASGRGWVSTTTLRGRRYLRAGIVNYLSTKEDADLILQTLRELSAALG